MAGKEKCLLCVSMKRINQKRGMIAFLALTCALIFLLLAQTGLAKNIFYTTQSSNATFETAQAESDLTNGLAGHWSFNTADKSNRTNATDKSGMQNHGAITGGAMFMNAGRG